MKYFSLLVLFLVSSLSFAAEIPYSAELEARLSSSYKGAHHVARAVYDASRTNYGSSTVNSGVHGLGVTIPANAVITASYFYTKTAIVGSGSKVGFQCEDTNNILDQTDLTGNLAGTIINAKQNGASAVAGGEANMVAAIANGCEISAVVSEAPVTAGKLILFVDYVIAE